MENIFVAMILDMWEFTCCAWTCRKYFVGYLGHVGILIVHGYGKNLVVVYGHMKNFDCGKIFGGALIFLGAWF